MLLIEVRVKIAEAIHGDGLIHSYRDEHFWALKDFSNYVNKVELFGMMDFQGLHTLCWQEKLIKCQISYRYLSQTVPNLRSLYS